MIKPKVLIFAGYGLNCDEETKYAFDTAGARADIGHINDVIKGRFNLSDYQILTFQGGFAYGDDTGAGNAYAMKMKNYLWEELLDFIKKDRLIIGICNGFQILVNLGILPAVDNKYGDRQVAFVHNNSARYIVRFVDIKVINNSPWLKNIDTISIPISHGEGKLYCTAKVLNRMKKNNQIVLKYFKGEMCNYLDLPGNPNGSIDDIAGITDESGRIFGLMPHPERAIFIHQLPNWTLVKEKYLREKKTLPQSGPGLQIFKNAIQYFQ